MSDWQEWIKVCHWLTDTPHLHDDKVMLKWRKWTVLKDQIWNSNRCITILVRAKIQSLDKLIATTAGE